MSRKYELNDRQHQAALGRIMKLETSDLVDILASRWSYSGSPKGAAWRLAVGDLIRSGDHWSLINDKYEAIVEVVKLVLNERVPKS